MKLSPDCTRDVLMAIEDVVDLQTKFKYTPGEKTPERLKRYDPDVIAYHVNQCNLSGLLIGCEIFCYGGLIIVADLTPAGHEFLANIRQDSVWQKTKEIAAKIGSNSMSSLVQIACGVVTEIIRNSLGFT